jgi:hypothetical protein
VLPLAVLPLAVLPLAVLPLAVLPLAVLPLAVLPLVSDSLPLAPAYKFREVESRISERLSQEYAHTDTHHGWLLEAGALGGSAIAAGSRTVTEKALREISAQLLGGCAWSCTGRKVELGREHLDLTP